MQTQRAQLKPWAKAEKWLLASIFGILALAAFIVIGSRYLRPVHDLVVPTPTMPSPNAFDYDISAGNQVSAAHPVLDTLWRQVSSSAPDPRTVTLAQTEVVVRQNQAVLRTVRQGLSFPYLSPPVRSINDKAHYWARERDLARLLALDGQVKAAHGDWNGAAQNDLDAIQMGEQIPHGAVIIGDLVGISCQAIGRHFLWAAADHLTAAQAKAAARRLQKIQAALSLRSDVARRRVVRPGGHAGTI